MLRRGSFSFSRNFFFFSTLPLYQIGEALKNKISSRVCMYARIVELYTFLFIFLLFLFYQKKGFGNNALKFRTLGKKWQ